MSDDDDVIDIEKARERRARGELPPSLRQGVIVRRGFGLSEAGFCAHHETIVDTQARLVRCRSCGADLDAMDVLGQIAFEWERLAEAIKERERLDREIADLRAEEKRVKSRLRNARKRANREVPPVPGEIAALRDAVEVLRSFSPYGSARKALDRVDAATSPPVEDRFGNT